MRAFIFWMTLQSTYVGLLTTLVVLVLKLKGQVFQVQQRLNTITAVVQAETKKEPES